MSKPEERKLNGLRRFFEPGRAGPPRRRSALTRRGLAITETTTRLAFAAYRPRPGKTDELLRLFGEELATLRRRGHVTQRSAPVVRTDDGELLVVLEWSSPHAVDDAHSDPEVVALWEQKGQLADYLPLRALADSQVPFASWPVVAEV